MREAPALRPDQRLVVVGASLAGLRAVEAARKNGFRGHVVLIGDETHPPYDRPPLSKSYLVGDLDDSTLRPLSSYADDLAVELRLGVTATSLRTDVREVVTSAGSVRYDRLVVATGSTARRHPRVPDLEGVHVLRTRGDAQALRRVLGPDRRVVVVGGGFIGAEVASTCRALGASVTIVEAAPVPLVRAVGDRMGRVLAELHPRHGVPLRTGVSVAAVHGERSVSSVELEDGSELPADVVVLGVGARPATEWLETSGLALDPTDGGVCCDATLRCAPDVWAAGDVAWWDNAAFGGRMRLENWTNASQQGTHVGRQVAVGGADTFSTVPYAWTDWYGHRIQLVGVASTDEVVTAGDLGESRFVALFRAGERLSGALTVNQPGRTMKWRALIDRGASWREAREFAGLGPQLVSLDR